MSFEQTSVTHDWTCTSLLVQIVDTALSDTKACALAVKASLEKLNLNDHKIVLDGQTTDSGGGGGVLDRLAEEPHTLELTVDLGECTVLGLVAFTAYSH